MNSGNRLILIGETFKNRVALKKGGAYWEAKAKQWTIHVNAWNLIKDKIIGVFAKERSKSDDN